MLLLSRRMTALAVYDLQNGTALRSRAQRGQDVPECNRLRQPKASKSVYAA